MLSWAIYCLLIIADEKQCDGVDKERRHRFHDLFSAPGSIRNIGVGQVIWPYCFPVPPYLHPGLVI